MQVKAPADIDSAFVYNDINGLDKLKNQGDQNEAAALRQVAKQFESMFTAMMLKSMRDANAVFEEDDPLNSYSTQFYKQMYDDQLALTLSQGNGLGLADSLYRQLSGQFHIGDEKAAQVRDVPIRDVYGKAGKAMPLTEQNKIDMQAIIQGDKTRRARVQNPAENNELQINQAKSVTPPEQPAASATSAVPAINQSESSAKEKNKTSTAEGLLNKQAAFESPEEFVAALWPVAEKIGYEMGVNPKAIIAQAALETGWGKSVMHDQAGRNAFNLFGIKADARWQGSAVSASTLEYRDGVANREVASFRAYESYEDSFRDYADFVRQSARYQQALGNGDDVQKYSQGLQQGGYATDPHYALKIQRIAGSDLLNSAISQIKRG
ncbi:MAG: flagellar assembly peptidoglycan hydrolase FlgJ [Oceanospirillaceae bacterium]|nr:flagellar assembly peptidoglycan hydrolase FlgJ [Oceanospirillaceae bacterium]MCP5350115.1 flagellar assembly peptidoglycan hydrolase FlgJ [Oceanospirillaceae bacterium]